MPWFAADVVRDPRVASLLLRFHRLSEWPGSSALEREACLAEGLLLLAGRHAEHGGRPGHPVASHGRYGSPRSSLTSTPRST